MQNSESTSPNQGRAHAVALFSGGLDSILASLLIQEQGLDVTCLHFVTPFFGKPQKISYWQRIYGLKIKAVDISEEYVRMLAERPAHGFGSVLNPCVDCKILMLRHAKTIMEDMGACCIISGEVLGQRPMSQRRDTLNVIRRDADVRPYLLRPLCAQHMDPTDAEIAGIVDRTRLLGLSGRGRKGQMELAQRFGLKDIPTPAGGCRLTEQENARSYWPLLQYASIPNAGDFRLANTGRQYWHFSENGETAYWLTIGRNQMDNDSLMSLAGPDDLVFKTKDFPGPIALGRRLSTPWPQDVIASAAAFVASYSGKAVRFSEENGAPVAVRVHPGSLDAPGDAVDILPSRSPALAWREYTWAEAHTAIKAERTPQE